MISSIWSALSGSAIAVSSSRSSAATALTAPAPSMTSATALRPAISPTSWLKEPMVMPRSVETCPSSGNSSPAIIRNSVVFPAPFGPTRPIFSPLLRAAEASMNRIWWPACLLTLSRRIMGSFWGIVALQRHRPCRPPGEARPDPDQPRAPPNSRNSTRSLDLVDLHGLHHAHLLMVHHVAVEHVDAGEIDEARAEHALAALALHDHGIPPFRHRQCLAIGRDHLERVGMDVEHVVVMLMGVDDGPLLDRAELHPLIDTAGVELLAVDEELEFLPMAGGIGLRRGRRQHHLATVGDLGILDGRERRRRQGPRQLHVHRRA